MRLRQRDDWAGDGCAARQSLVTGVSRGPGWGVRVADGNAYFNRPGPRIVGPTEILDEILQPDVCDYEHLGTAYHAYAV
jgi:hypothetical protein